MSISEEKETCHVPVLREETVEMLRAQSGGEFLDCTLGGGGHTEAILQSSSASSVVALDRDASAIGRAKGKLSKFEDRVTYIHGSFADLPRLIGDRRFDGILADLGTSMDQLKGGRGFSFHDEDALDMRMDTTQGETAAELLDRVTEHELFVIFRKGGVGTEAKMLAREIIRHRPYTTATRLGQVASNALRGRNRSKEGHAATLAFQAIRMAVNQELEQIEKLLDFAPSILRKGGRLAVITFHSLEDRVVTGRMRTWEQGDTMPSSWPGVRTAQSLGKVLTKKPVVPSEAEVQRNPASRSARLRVFECS